MSFEDLGKIAGKDPVLMNAADMLETAARKCRRLALLVNSKDEAKRVISEIHANINAALARIPE